MTMINCDVYWGSHACRLANGHGERHRCSCCSCADHAQDPEDGCVGAYPYYGPGTQFNGRDVRPEDRELQEETKDG